MPTTKVTTGAVVGSAVIIALWLIKVSCKIEVPGEIGAAITTVASFITSYLTPDPND